MVNILEQYSSVISMCSLDSTKNLSTVNVLFWYPKTGYFFQLNSGFYIIYLLIANPLKGNVPRDLYSIIFSEKLTHVSLWKKGLNKVLYSTYNSTSEMSTVLVSIYTHTVYLLVQYKYSITFGFYIWNFKLLKFSSTFSILAHALQIKRIMYVFSLEPCTFNWCLQLYMQVYYYWW